MTGKPLTHQPLQNICPIKQVLMALPDGYRSFARLNDGNCIVMGISAHYLLVVHDGAALGQGNASDAIAPAKVN